MQFMTGVDCHKNDVARLFVLTESDEAIAAGLDIITQFKELIRWLKRGNKTKANYRPSYPLEYSWVLHRQGTKKRVNLHVVFYGSYIPQQLIENEWMKLYKSHRSKMEKINNMWKLAWYLAKYLSKDGSEEFVKSYFSRGWVFPGWIGYSKWLKKEFAQYPPKDMLKNYHGMTKDDLKNDLWYSVYLAAKSKKDKKIVSLSPGDKDTMQQILKLF